MICDDCEQEKEDAYERNCPFAEEVLEVKLKRILCDYCYHERYLESRDFE